MDNRHVGRLYVLEGQLTNNLPAPRCRILIKATLLDVGGQELSHREFVAGTTATISELKLLDWNELQAILTPSGQDLCQTTTIQPGGSGRFMTVFRDPPAQASTFDLIVSDSQPPGPTPK